jgi:hypothetical protein
MKLVMKFINSPPKNMDVRVPREIVSYNNEAIWRRRGSYFQHLASIVYEYRLPLFPLLFSYFQSISIPTLLLHKIESLRPNYV